jgi:hypothetical protein
MYARSTAILHSVTRPFLLGVVFLVWSGLCFADPAEDKREAKRVYAIAEKAYIKRDYRAAAEGFDQAYKLSPRLFILWNAAQAWEKAGDPVRAANLLEQYLAEAPPGARDRETATTTLKDLNTRLSRIEARGMGVTDLKIDGAPVKDGTPIYVTAGEHAASGDASGTPVQKTVRVDPGQLMSVTLEPPPPPPPRPIIVQKKGLPPWVPIATGGATLVVTGITIWSGLNTVGLKNDFDGSDSRAGDSRGTNQDILDSSKSAQLRTNIFIGVTVGLALVTGVLVALTDWKGAPKQGSLPGVVRW